MITAGSLKPVATMTDEELCLELNTHGSALVDISNSDDPSDKTFRSHGLTYKVSPLNIASADRRLLLQHVVSGYRSLSKETNVQT